MPSCRYILLLQPLYKDSPTGSSHLTGKLFLHSHDATAADKDSQEDLQEEQEQD